MKSIVSCPVIFLVLKALKPIYASLFILAAKVINRHWLAVNMNYEANLGFNAFNTRKITGQDVIDFIEFRKRQAQGDAFDAEFMAAVLGKPQD